MFQRTLRPPHGIAVHPMNTVDVAVNLKNTKGVAVDPQNSCALQVEPKNPVGIAEAPMVIAVVPKNLLGVAEAPTGKLTEIMLIEKLLEHNMDSILTELDQGQPFVTCPDNYLPSTQPLRSMPQPR